MGEIFATIWRRIVMQFSDQARHGLNSTISRNMDSARDSLMGNGKKDDE